MQRFNVVIPKSGGGVEIHAMKEWLRQHPEHIPAGLDPTSSNSHQLKNGLRKRGWSVEELPTEIRLFLPGSSASDSVMDEILGDQVDDQENESVEPSFGLEYQLRDFIAQNMAAIAVHGKKLQLYVDPTGRDGIEYPSPVGPIDILAVDELGCFVVFELKRGRSPDQAIGQLARYMGWIKQTIGREREVQGVIVAKEIGEKLRYAASVLPGVSLFEYEVEFHLRPAQDLPVVPST